ncbi:MAG: S-layer homology domain-containing protein [Desulfotomaculaceae bacterium]|nr:S-layer homology domain-containing protein [Desulfotomaculaceae bacterium]
MKSKNKILLAIGLAAVMILMFAGQSLAAPPDIQNHWAEKQITDWVEKGYISGYPDGSFKPDNTITRAEFVTMVNRAFGKNATAPVSFPDVSSNDWFAAEVARAVAAGYISGYDDGAFRPNENIKRQEAAVIITRLLNLAVSEDAEVLNQFADYVDIPQWSKGYIGAVVAAGYMSGYPDQTYQPVGYITRAEAVSTLERALAASIETTTYDMMGTYGPAEGVKTIDGSVNISAAGVTLQNTVITGNLFLAESIGDGDVALKNVIVQGNTVIKGGGSQSVALENCSMPNITVGKNGVRIVASGNTSVSVVRLETGAALIEVGLSGPGFETVTVTELAPAGAEITLDGNFANVNVYADTVKLVIAGGSVANMNIAETAVGSAINIAADAIVSSMTLDAAVSVTGQGTIETAKVNVSGSTFEQEPINVDKAEDIDVTTGTGGGSPTGTITISNISSTNTLGKFKFDTDTVTTIGALQGKIMADGVDAINIAKRNNGEDGKVWNAFIDTTPYEYDTEYVITCEAPFKISGNDTVVWSSSAAAPAATNVTAKDVGNSGDGSDLEVSFDAPKGQNTRVETYRVLVVKTADAASFTLSDANAADDYTTVVRIEDKPGYTVVLAANAKDVDGDAINEGVSYKVFVLSVADGINATENALSASSASIVLKSGGGGGGTPTETITISNISSTNTLGKFKFDTDKVTTIAKLAGNLKADGVDAINIAKRNNGEDGKVWNAFLATTPYEYDTEYKITCEAPFKISGNDTVVWSSSAAAPAATNVTAKDVGNSGDGSDLEVSFDAPKGQNTRVETYRVLVVKTADAASFTLSDANAADDYTTVVRIEDKPGYTVVLAAGAKDVDGDTITEDVSYKVFVLSVADGVNATENALSAASAPITLSSGGGEPAAAPTFVSAEVTTQGDVSVTFDKDMADPAGKQAQFTVKVDGADAQITTVELTKTTSKIKLVMATKITSGQVVTVAYTKGADDAGQVKAADGGMLETFAAQSVTNNIPAAPPTFVSTEVTTQGDVSVTFDKDMADPAGKQAQFTVKVDGADAQITTVELTKTTSKIKLVMATKITSGQVVTVAYTKGADDAGQVKAADGGMLETFAAQPVTNNR